MIVCKEGFTLNAAPSGISISEWLNSGVPRPWHQKWNNNGTFTYTPTKKCVTCLQACGPNNAFVCDNYLGCKDREYDLWLNL